MGLKQRLEQIKNNFSQEADQETLDIMHDAIEDLKSSGKTSDALGENDRAPSFVLPDIGGENVSLSDYLAEGPVVLSFYRGVW